MKSAAGIRYSDSDSMFCQNPKCTQGDAVTAVKVCHNCSSRPMLLCAACDKKAHAELRSKGHMRFDLPTSVRPLSAMAQGTSAATVAVASSGQTSLVAGVGGGGTEKSSTVLPIHTRSMSLPDRRAFSSALSSFDPQPTAFNQAVTSHFKFPSGDEDSEDGAEAREETNLDDSEPFDEPDGRYRRTDGGKFVFQNEYNGKWSPLVGEGKHRPLPQDGSTNWILATAEMLDQSPKGSYFTVHVHLTPDGDPEVVEVPAQKGVRIRQALDQLLESHRLSFNQVDVYVGSMLPLTSVADTFFLSSMTLRVIPHGQPWKELTRRLSNGSFQSGASDRSAPGRADDVRGSSLDTAAFRKSSSSNMLKPPSASSSSSSLGVVTLQGRSSYAGFRRGNQRDSRQQLDVSSAGISRLLHLSEDYAGGRHGATAGASASDDGGSEAVSSSAGVAAALVVRPLRKTASAAGVPPGGASAASAYDDPHQDVSPSGTISKAWRGSAAVAQAAAGRLGSLLPVPYKERDKMERLQAKLDEWSRNGIPEMPELYAMNQIKFDVRVLEMEEHWTCFISPAGLTSRQKDQQEALWELLYTEVEYIKSIKYVVVELFMSCLFNLQVDQMLNDVAGDKMFANVGDVGDLNVDLWQNELLKVLEHSRRTHELLDPRMLKPAFHRFSERFHAYTKYCLEQPVCSEYLKKMDKENEPFRVFVAWAETQKQCNRLKLHDLLVKPMQRITRYSLLLNAILKKTDDPETRRDLEEMIANVDTFVRYVDQTLRHKHEEQRLKEMAARIESYDVVDMPYGDAEANRMLAAYSTLDVQQPMPGCGSQLRHLLYEGALKMKEASIKSDVICFLFTDMFLITKAKRADKVKITKAPMRIDRCVVEEFGKDGNAYFLIIQLTEYGVAQAAFAFHGENIAKWVKLIRKAQELYRSAQLAAQQQQPPPVHAPLGSTVLSGDVEDEMGFVGPDLPPLVGGEGSRADDGGAGGDSLGGGAAAAAAAAQLPNAAAESDDCESDAATTPTVGTSRRALGYGASADGSEEEEEEEATMKDNGYYGAHSLGAAVATAVAVAVARSASSPVMSTRPKANTLQQDESDVNYPDDKASNRRGGRRFLTADSIQPFTSDSLAGRSLQSGYATRADNRAPMNGEEQWELHAGAALFTGTRSPSADASESPGEEASSLEVRADGAARGGAVPPRAMPRKHVPPAAAAEHSTNGGGSGEIRPGRAAARGTGEPFPAAAVGGELAMSAAAGSRSDQDEGAVGGAAAPPNPSAATRSSRKLSQAELLRMRAQMFTSSPHDGAQV